MVGKRSSAMVITAVFLFVSFVKGADELKDELAWGDTDCGRVFTVTLPNNCIGTVVRGNGRGLIVTTHGCERKMRSVLLLDVFPDRDTEMHVGNHGEMCPGVPASPQMSLPRIAVFLNVNARGLLQARISSESLGEMVILSPKVRIYLSSDRLPMCLPPRDNEGNGNGWSTILGDGGHGSANVNCRLSDSHHMDCTPTYDPQSPFNTMSTQSIPDGAPVYSVESGRRTLRGIKIGNDHLDMFGTEYYRVWDHAV